MLYKWDHTDTRSMSGSAKGNNVNIEYVRGRKIPFLGQMFLIAYISGQNGVESCCQNTMLGFNVKATEFC